MVRDHDFHRSSAPIVVLGMHRSGTSCLAGTLQAAGLELGEVFTSNPHNARGNREHSGIIALHEAVLAENDCSWDRPPTHEPQWSSARVAERRALVLSIRGRGRWGFKDPRTLLVMEGWKTDFPRLRAMGIFRHPVSVAESLRQRAGGRIGHAQGLALWRHYNRRLLAEWQCRPFPLIEFTEDGQQLLKDLREACQVLDLPRPERAHAFFDPDLQHQSGSIAPLDAETTALLAELRDAARAWRPQFRSLAVTQTRRRT